MKWARSAEAGHPELFQLLRNSLRSALALAPRSGAVQGSAEVEWRPRYAMERVVCTCSKYTSLIAAMSPVT